MGIISKLFKRDPNPAQVRSWFGSSPTTVSNQVVTTESAMRVAAVFAAVKVISETIASLPLHTYKRLPKGKERDTNHHLSYLLHSQPNSFQTSFEFRSLQMVNVLLGGNAYARKLFTRSGKVGELIPLNPKLVKPHWNKSKTEIVYDFNENGSSPTEFKQSEILHIRGLSLDGVEGLGPIAAAREAIGLSMAAEKHAAALFGNGARPGSIIYYTNPLSEQAQQSFIKQWTEKFSGSGAGKVAMLQSGEAKFESLGMSNEDAQFIEVRQFQLSEIARIFRIPPHLIGDLSKATFSNIEQQSLEFVVHCLRPWLVNIEQSIMKSLFTEEERRTHFVEFSVDALLRGDITSRFAAYNTGIQAGFLSRDEVRELENRNPIPDGGGEIFLQPLNMAEVGKAPEETEKEEAEPVENSDEENRSKRPAGPQKTHENSDFSRVRGAFHRIAAEAISRAIKKETELARKAMSAGTLDDFVETLAEKQEQFLSKIIRSTALGYAQTLNPEITEDQVDEAIGQFCGKVYSDFTTQLIDEPNPGVVINQRELPGTCDSLTNDFLNNLEAL
jgi:HK97 family phage portal protein